jgi:hypothetical protein
MMPHPEWVVGAKKRVFRRFEVLAEIPPALDALLVDFDPVREFVRELSRRFRAIMNFWYDEGQIPLLRNLSYNSRCHYRRYSLF